MGRQRERRHATEALWGRLDELVHEWGKLPSPREPCALSTWNPSLCAQQLALSTAFAPAPHHKRQLRAGCGAGEKVVLRYGNHRAQALKSGRTREELLKVVAPPSHFFKNV